MTPVTTGDLLLIVGIAGQRVALRAAAVDSAIEVEALTPVPLAPVHVAGLTALRSRVLTAIDSCRALELAPVARSPARQAAVVVRHEGHHYALLVDAVEDVTPALSGLAALPARMAPGWIRTAAGLIETAEGPLLLIDPGAVIAGPASTKAAA